MREREQFSRFTRKAVEIATTNPFTRSLVRKLFPVVVEPTIGLIRFRNLESSLDQLVDSLDQNSLLVAVSNHLTLGDAAVVVEASRNIRRRVPSIEQFYLPIAASLGAGRQGTLPQVLYEEGVKPVLEKNRIIPTEMVTDNDVQKRGMAFRASSSRQIYDPLLQKGSAFFIFAEGTMQGGRYNRKGDMNGLQKVENQLLPNLYEKALQLGIRLVFFPIGISGTNRIVDPDSRFYTREGLGGVIGRRLGKDTIMANVLVGEPFTLDSSQTINDDIMTHIASLIPEEARGAYSK